VAAIDRNREKEKPHRCTPWIILLTSFGVLRHDQIIPFQSFDAILQNLNQISSFGIS
jgi:hypothetical protein